MARQKFESQATEKLLAVKSILPRMSRKYWKCDPDQHVEGETFVRLTHLLQVRYLKKTLYNQSTTHHSEPEFKKSPGQKNS